MSAFKLIRKKHRGVKNTPNLDKVKKLNYLSYLTFKDIILNVSLQLLSPLNHKDSWKLDLEIWREKCVSWILVIKENLRFVSNIFGEKNDLSTSTVLGFIFLLLMFSHDK